ncbi:MAG: branched-chain amino acid ABC transporter permease [Candidatus Pelethousia sp.]|nr:branched-chain amino acid ABC transporter permease [Candidatus Pelethousia sp.]
MGTFHKIYKNSRLWVLLLLAILFPQLVSNKYFLHVANLSMMFAMLTLSLNILSGCTGLMSVGHIAFYGIGAYTSAIFTAKLGLPILVGVLMAGVISALASLLLGLPTMRLRGMYFSVATLAFGEVLYQVFINWTAVTEGTKGIKGIPSPEFLGISFRSYDTYYYLVLAALVAAIVLTHNLIHSRPGRAMLSIRENDIAAEAMGVNIIQYKIIAFMVSAFFAGVAGALYVHEVHYVSPETFASSESAAVLAMMVVGGIGSIPGSILGGIALTVMPEMLRSFGNVRLVIYGAAVVAIIIFAPRGLGGLLEWVDSRLTGKEKGGIRRKHAKPEGEGVEQ